MSPLARRSTWVRNHPSFTYIAPFFCLLLLLVATAGFEWNPVWQAPIVALILAGTAWACLPAELEFKLADASGGALLGVALFLIWIAPDILWPGYRILKPFNNLVVGHLHSTLTPASTHSAWVLFWRSVRAVLLVPVIEEIFWRGWLMRWLISPKFQEIPLGSYAPAAFWVVAILFGLEHGPFWDVGLIAGIIYNWWAVRTSSIADIIWAHAVTNACLSVYVIGAGAWQYWQ
jgi:CAAX prenyl protease-like protein